MKLMKYVNYLFGDYFFSIKRKKFEDALIDEVLRISGFVKTNDLKVILVKLASSSNQLISSEFKLILNKINKGHTPKEVFNILKNKYNSSFLSNFLDLLEYSVFTGTVTSKDYKNLVKDFLKSRELFDERTSILLMQKYTILFAGGFIVPGILGVVISLVKSLTGIVDISVVGLTSNSSLFIVSYYCAIVYLVEYVIISSIYLSQIDSNSKKVWIYLCFLLPVSLLIFFVSSYIV
ncbi:MAG: hypothetical protein PHX47_02935 [Candidatus ainarchaeum sp.]|jgi:hypothetical protein|nr:hypothetical protein [Candidatus ainarchaeum sp.]